MSRKRKVVRRKAVNKVVTLYVLKLDDTNYYIGSTKTNMKVKMNSFAGNGKSVPSFVKQHSTVELVKEKTLFYSHAI